MNESYYIQSKFERFGLDSLNLRLNKMKWDHYYKVLKKSINFHKTVLLWREISISLLT